MVDRTRAVVADDSPLMRRGIEQVLTDSGVDVVATFGDAASMLQMMLGPGRDIDVAVVDIKMPPTFVDEGVAALETLRAAGATTGIVLLSMYLDPGYVIRALDGGTANVGYLLKDRIADLESFVEAVERVARGGSAIDPAVVEALARRPKNDHQLRRMTEREREVLQLVAEGRSNRSIAAILHVNDKTVETHIKHIFQKLDLAPSSVHHRRVLATLKWLNGHRDATGT